MWLISFEYGKDTYVWARIKDMLGTSYWRSHKCGGLLKFQVIFRFDFINPGRLSRLQLRFSSSSCIRSFPRISFIPFLQKRRFDGSFRPSPNRACTNSWNGSKLFSNKVANPTFNDLSRSYYLIVPNVLNHPIRSQVISKSIINQMLCWTFRSLH